MAAPGPASSEDARLREEQRTRRRFTRRQWARRFVSVRRLLALLLVVALLGTAVWLVFFSALLSVRTVQVDGADLLGADAVRRAGEVPVGEQLALVDLDRVRSRVGALAEVKEVDVTRAWPDTVRIEVTERTPVAVVELGGRWRGLDEEGVVFRDYRTPPRDLPRVRPTTSTGSDALVEAAAVVSGMSEDLAGRVDHVEVQTIDQITLVLRDGREVVWGSAEESDLKAEVLDLLLASHRAKVYDVSVPGSPTTR